MTWLQLLGILLVAVIAAFLLLSWWMPKRWYRKLLYGGGRPNPVAKRLNAISAWMFSRGVLPQFLVTLETRGSRSGRTYRIPLVVAEVNGKRYLVSMLGEKVDWVRNVRAAHGEATLHYGPTEEVVLHEVPIEQRAPILKAYLARAPGGRPHFDIAWNAPLAEFERIASRYPVFEVLPRGRDA